tara:strand:- start:2699 stop:3121 length:423 start_codon:yes stop_codon:yes gene_type:complete
MPNIRVEYTKEGENILIDRDVSNNDEIQKVFDDIGQLIGLPSKGLRQEYDSIYEGISVDSTDDQFTFNFYEEGGGQTSSPFEAVVADQVSWNEKYPNSLYATWPFPDSKLSEDIDISDRPAQPTFRVDSDDDNNFYYNGT